MSTYGEIVGARLEVQSLNVDQCSPLFPIPLTEMESVFPHCDYQACRLFTQGQWVRTLQESLAIDILTIGEDSSGKAPHRNLHIKKISDSCSLLLLNSELSIPCSSEVNVDPMRRRKQGVTIPKRNRMTTTGSFYTGVIV